MFGRVQLIFIDTNPFIKRYYDKNNEWSHCPGELPAPLPPIGRLMRGRC